VPAERIVIVLIANGVEFSKKNYSSSFEFKLVPVQLS